MAVAEDHDWNRSRYPLQGLFQPSAQRPQSTLILGQKDNQAADGPATWYRAVTDDRVKRYSITSSHHSAEDVQVTDGSATAVSGSHRSESPSSMSNGGRLRSGEGEDASPTVYFHRYSQAKVVDGAKPWTRNNYPLQAATDVSAQNHSLKSSTTTLEGEYETTSQILEPDQKAPVMRTLRRTPRSRRINPSTPPPVSEEPPASARSNDSEHEPASLEPSVQRKSYPLQAPTSTSVVSHPISPPSEKHSDLLNDPSSTHLPESESHAPVIVSWGRKAYPLQSSVSASAALPASPPPSESESESMKEAFVDQPPRSDEASKKTKSWGRRAYPLQAPASNRNLQRSPTPPSSPERDQQLSNNVSESQTHEIKAAPAQKKPLRRQAYPLQSPASAANLQRSPTPQSLPDEEAQPVKEMSTNQNQGQTQTTKKTLRRQAYPLQSPASVANLQRSQTPQPIVEAKADLANDTPQQQPQESLPSAKGIFRRQAYPLQSPASIKHLRSSPAPETTAQKTFESENAEPDEQPREEVRHREKALRRQLYPLQSPASIVDLQAAQALPPLLPTIVEPPNEEKPSVNQAREAELATKVINQWRRQVYPLQSPDAASPFYRAPTPQPPEEETQKERKPEAIVLPRNIRAVKDAGKQESTGRTIVICLDGTGDKFDNDNSNIVHLVSALKKDDPSQVSYYQAGIGTYSAGGLSSGISAAMDMAVGSGLGLHVRDAYHFLMHTYKEGDRICIFGFSRGAYTARCLAGMIHKVGLLPPRNVEQIEFAYEFYANDTPEGWKQSEDFKKTFCIDVCVYFIGCFDSVASVGFIPRQLPLSGTPTTKARYFRHAMALDERRAKFKVCRHTTKKWSDITPVDSPADAVAKSASFNLLRFLPSYKDQNDTPPNYSSDMVYGKTHHPNVTDAEYERLTGREAPFDTDVLEVWFAGAHADIGGGAVPNDERHKLAQIPLRWMIRQAFECNTGIIFKTKVLAEHGLDVHTLWPKYERLNLPSHGPPPSFLEKYDKGLPPRSIRRNKFVPTDAQENEEPLYHFKSPKDEDWTPEQIEDFYDALSPLNDQLIDAPSWWILEAWPVQYKVPTAPGQVEIRTGMNLGRYRGVDDAEPNLHWTVRHREKHRDYKINARTATHTTWRSVV